MERKMEHEMEGPVGLSKYTLSHIVDPMIPIINLLTTSP